MSSLRVGVLSGVLLSLPFVYSASASEPDDLLASTNQFSTIFSDMGWGFPYLSPVEDHDYCVAKYQWWTDFSAMPQAVSGNISVSVTATGTYTISGYRIFVDGDEVDRGPSSITNYVINTCEWGNGIHSLFAVADDTAGIGLTPSTSADSANPLRPNIAASPIVAP
jgi:hypothetical protein